MKNILLCFFILASLVSEISAQPILKISEAEGNNIFENLITTIYTELGYDIEVISVPAERGLVNVNFGFYDADMARVSGVISEYPNLMETAEPIIEGYLQFWVKNDSKIVITSPKDLDKHKIGLIIGMKRAENYIANIDIEPVKVTTMEQLHLMLMANRIDVALVPSTAITPDFSEGLYAVEPELQLFRGFHILHRKHADLAPRFDAILRDMKADGRYQMLISTK